MNQKETTPIMKAIEELQHENKVSETMRSINKESTQRYTNRIALNKMIINRLTALLPTERDCLKKAYSEGVGLGMREVSCKVNHKLDVTVDVPKHFDTFYSQFETEK